MLLIMAVNLRLHVTNCRRLVILWKNLIKSIGFCVILADRLKHFPLLFEPLVPLFSFGIFLPRQKGTSCFSNKFMGLLPHLSRSLPNPVTQPLTGGVVVGPLVAVGVVAATLLIVSCVERTVIMLMCALGLLHMLPTLPLPMMLLQKRFMPNVMFLRLAPIGMLIPLQRITCLPRLHL